MWERLLDQLLDSLIRRGRLRLTWPDGSERSYGSGGGEISVRLHDPALPRRLVLNPDLAVGEAYMDGTLTIEGDDLHGFLGLILRNRGDGASGLPIKVNHVLRKAIRKAQQTNPIGRAQQNVAHHYDLSGALYELFLDGDRQYSCAYFRSPGDSLEQAQAQKKAHIAGKLLIEPGMRVLDIGCGWGGMGLTLARDYGAEVLGVTLSEEQHKIAQARAEAAGLSDKVEFRLTDYREVTGQFDRIVSVGMFEHVGVPHYREYFSHVRDKLTEDGVALIHTIGRVDPPGTTSPFIQKYIFPGGYVPAMSEVLAAIEKEGLWTTDVEVWRLHYAETLLHWHDRFKAREDEARALYDERFCRMWRFYLVGSEMSFRANKQTVFQFQLARRQDAVPLTRDYLYS
jgi:cyclopropane-fatty-acyl-phospholipid synthase